MATRRQPSRHASRSLAPASDNDNDDSDDDRCDTALTTCAAAADSVSSRHPVFVPFQLSDEMYAHIIRDPSLWGYPTLPPGSVRSPKFGHIWVEVRTPGVRRPKLVDGFDWVPSSTANASTRLLRDGETELLRYYCARRTKDDSAKPTIKPFTIYQREVYDEVKAEYDTTSQRATAAARSPQRATAADYERRRGPHEYEDDEDDEDDEDEEDDEDDEDDEDNDDDDDADDDDEDDDGALLNLACP